jgi:hypothetical protein
MPLGLRHVIYATGGAAAWVLISDILVKFFRDYNVTDIIYNWLLNLVGLG